MTGMLTPGERWTGATTGGSRHHYEADQVRRLALLRSRSGGLRKKLMQLLPRGVGVGSGCVIDSYGNTSKQMDVFL